MSLFLKLYEIEHKINFKFWGNIIANMDETPFFLI